jgi:hypothetical protein
VTILTKNLFSKKRRTQQPASPIPFVSSPTQITPTLVSPKKQIHLDESSAEEEINTDLTRLLGFVSFQSPIDLSWWSYIRTLPELKPTISQSDPHSVKITIVSPPPTTEQ